MGRRFLWVSRGESRSVNVYFFAHFLWVDGGGWKYTLGGWGWMENVMEGGVDGGERKYILGWWWWVDIFSGWVGMGVYGS